MLPTLPFERILLRTLAEHVPQRIYAKDVHGRFVFANHAVARGMGVSHPDELIGHTDDDFYPRPSAAQYREEERAIVRTGQPMVNREEHVHYSLSGIQAWMLTTKVPLRDERGQVVGIAGINHDITERKAMEEALREARRQAEQATRAKSEFLAAMSHELRTPLNAVLGYAKVLQDDSGLSGEQRAGLGTIERSGRHLLMLIEDLLDIAKIEAGKLDLAPAEVHLADLVQTVTAIVRVKAAHKHLALACEVDTALPALVLVDGRRLSQVLLNLLANAVKFTDAGKVGLRVRTLSSSATQVQVGFEVSDTGVGMHADELGRIFDAYEQVGEPSRRAAGTGLGLSISQRLVQTLGGEISVHSTPGIGSVFSFALDLPVPPACEAACDAVSVAGMALPDMQMQQLVTLARTGNMRDIGRFAVQLSAMGEPYRHIAQSLSALAGRCESKAILDLVMRLPGAAACP